MKTKKYLLESEAIETMMIEKIEITKKQYDQMIRGLEKRLIETQSDEYPIEKDERVYHFDNYVEIVKSYRCGCYTTYLTQLICNAGYCWKTKKEQKR